MPKVLTVIGATGIQGSSVINAALKTPSNWHIRGLTRNPDSAVAKALKEKGIEVVKADLNDAASLAPAFAGSYAIFAATDFFGPFANLGAHVEKTIALEWDQTRNVINAALVCDTLQHFVWSALPHADRISGGKCRPSHFEAKNRGEDLIRSHPDLLAKTTFAYVGWYATNFAYPTFKPAWMETANTFIQMMPVGADTPLYTIGDPLANIGTFILQSLAHPEVTLPGGIVHVAIEETSNAKLLEAWSHITGKAATYVQTTAATYNALWPGWGLVEAEMFRFYDGFRGRPWASEGESMVMAEDLGIDVGEMVGVEEALLGMKA